MPLDSVRLVLVLPLLLAACPGDDGTNATSAGTTGSSTTSGTTGDDPQTGTTATTQVATDTSGGTSTGPGGSSSGSATETDDGGSSTTGDGGSSSTGGGSSSSDGGSSSSSGGGGGPLQIGEECLQDSDCMTNVCWDFSDYDPFCFGTACSFNCINDAECVMGMAAAGAPNPMASQCGPDGRCTTIGTGFGLYACAGPS